MTIKFNLSTDNYSTFIQQIRDWAKDPKRGSHGRSVLPYPPSDPKKAEYMDIELRAKVNKDDVNPKLLIVKIKRHNLYVVGYLMEGAQKWLEFKPEKDESLVIPNSENLGYTGSYTMLGVPKEVGYYAFKDCITNLAVTTDTVKRKSSLSTLIVMISESVRFQKLFDLFYKQMQRETNMNYDRWMGILVKYWDKLSNRLLCEDQFAITFRLPDNPKTRKPHELTETKELNIVTSGDAAKCIAVLFGNPASIEDLEEGDYPIQWEGTRLLQVFSVGINTSDSDAQIYGKVEVKDDFGTYVLYNRQRTVSEFVRNTQTLTLDGPANRSLSSRTFKVSLDLKKQGKTPSADTQVSNGSFEYKVYEVNKIFDDRLYKVVSSKSGSYATVYFTAFRDAIQATVEVVLTYVDPKEDDPVDLYGSLLNRYDNYDYDDEETKMYYGAALFKKSGKDNSVKVQKGSPIPLSRQVIAVPTSANLILDAKISSMKTRNFIFLGSVEFPPQLDGKSVKEIRGQYGHVRVTVSWEVVPDSV